MASPIIVTVNMTGPTVLLLVLLKYLRSVFEFKV